MKDTPLDFAAPVRAFACRTLFAQAVHHLGLAEKSEPIALFQALDAMGGLPPSLRELAWMRAFVDPERSFRRAESAVRELWVSGIDRRCAPPPLLPARSVRLLAVIAQLAPEQAHGALAGARRMAAFDALWRIPDDLAAAWAAVELYLTVQASECSRLMEVCKREEFEPKLLDVVGAACWLHALASASAPDAAPPKAKLARQFLSMPSLRGLRRRGFRQHGRALAEGLRLSRMAASRKGLDDERGSSLTLPACLLLVPSLSDLTRPLVRDLLTSLVGELAPGEVDLSALLALAEDGPRLVHSCASVLEKKPALETVADRLKWLGAFLGLESRDDENPVNIP